MVAIVSGNSLGLSLSSLATLGQRGALGTAGQGRSGEQSFVNIANGNLVLQNRDDVLVGRGLDVSAVRTYNSQGLLNDDNADNWAVAAFGRSVQLSSGTLGAVGSTVTRTDRDGAQAVYTWDAASSRYVSPAGAGAFDTIAYNSGASQLIWTDGATGNIERYQSGAPGRLLSASDADGNTVTVAYNTNGTVQSVTDANGDISYYDYTGTNLSKIRSVSGGVTTTTVLYAYDTSNRLVSVTVDLSPQDNATGDGKVYTTTYTYDGSSKRIASVTQTDGTKLSFTYVQVGADYKVASVTDALGAVTRFAYDTAQKTTTVTDALGAQSVYLYDAQGQLLQVRNGVTAANATGLGQISYAYDADGNVTLVTDGEGNKVSLTYDAQGNLTREVDSAGDTRVRTYNAANQLLTDTLYADAATSRGAFSTEAALPETTRYVYSADPSHPTQLRFAISAEGDVTEYGYDANGQRTSAVRFQAGTYAVGGLALTEVPTEAQMVTWRGAQDLTRSERTELDYDARGELKTSKTYSSVAANGTGNAIGAAATQYIYDQRGLLLQTIDAAGGTTNYLYDGLGRLLSVIAPSPAAAGGTVTTLTSYDDANGKTTLTLANGLLTVSAYDKAGRLISVTQSSAGTGVLGTTSYAYDADGNLLMTQDPTGVRKWMLYDEADRKIADIDATGAVIEYVYNANGQLRQTIAYATPINTAGLVDGAGKPTTSWSATNTTTSLNALRPATTAQDQKVWRFYDTANRLTWQVDALGYVTQTIYDGASRILSVTQLANPVDVTQLGNGANIQLLIDPATVGGVTLSFNTAPAPLGSAVTLTATIAGASPGGMVTFFSGETVVGSAMVVNGIATLTTNELSIGANSIRAAYSGDATRPASLSAIGTKTITPATTSVTLGSSSDYYPAVFGAPVVLSANIANQLAGVSAPGGEVSFYSGTVLLGTAALLNGTATLTVTGLSGGNQLIRAEYSGDASHTTATGSRNVAITPRPTRTTMGVAGTGSSAQIYASVNASAEPSTPPTGTLTFYSGSTVIGTVSLVDGAASIPFPSSGSGRLNAVYSGDANNAASRVQFTDWVTSPIQTQTVLTASAAGGSQDDTIVLTAQVTGSGTTGLVTFFSGKTPLGIASVVNGVATLAVNNLPVGHNTIQAAYAGDVDNAASVAQDVDLDITAGTGTVPRINTFGTAPTSGIGSTVQGTPQLGLPASFYTTLWPQNPDQHPLHGAIGIFDGDNLIGSYPQYNARGGGSHVPVFDLALGDHAITMVYSGDEYYASSASTPVIPGVTVQPAGTAVAMTSSNPQSAQGGPVTLTATVTHNPAAVDYYSISGDGNTNTAYSSAPTATGTVTFYNGTEVIGTASVVNGVATLVINTLPVGTQAISAKYQGDGSNAASTSGAVNQQVSATPWPVSLGVTRLTATSSYGAPTEFLINSYGTGRPLEGTVQLYEGAQLLGSAQLVNGRVITSVPGMSVGWHVVRVVYPGDGNNASGVTEVGFTVTQAPTTLTNQTAASVAKDGPLSVVVNGVGATGLVSFYDGTTLIGTAAVVNGVATLTGMPLPAGSHNFTAVYAGDANNVGSQLSFAQVVSGTPVTTVIASLDILVDRTVTELYTREGRLQGVLDAEGYLTEYKYNAAGELVETIRYANLAANFTSVSARLAAVAIARASYSLTGLRPSLNASADIHSYNLYNARGQIVGQVDGEGYLTETTYDTRGNLVQSTHYANRAGAVSANSTLASIRPGLNAAQDQTILQTWGAANQLLTRTNAEGTVTQFVYDNVGQLIETTTALGTADARTSRALYDVQGRLIGEVDGRGSDSVTASATPATWALYGTTHTYDAAGRRASSTDANGHRTLFFYDPIGRLQYTVNALGEVSESRYNPLGQLTDQVVYGTRVDVATLGGTNPGGLVSASVTAAIAAIANAGLDSHVVRTYHATGTLASRTDALTGTTGSTTSFAYNAFREAIGSSQALTSGYVVTNTSAFDRRGLLTTSAQDAAGVNVVRRNTYDAFGRSITRTDGNGNLSSQSYDRLGRILTTTDGAGGVHRASYDAFDRILSQTDALNNTTSYSYNQTTRSATVTTPEGVTLTTVRNRQGETATITDGRGNTTTYEYDKSGNLLKSTAPLANVTGATYDKTGLVLTSTDANGVVTSYSYDAVNRLLTRTLDAAGLNLVTSYGYDAKGQTVSVTDPKGIVTTTAYDLNGLVVTQTVDPGGLNLQTVYTHDTNGTTLTVTSPNGTVTAYTYDGAGRRTQEQVDPLGLNLTRRYDYDQAGNVVKATDANGHVTLYTYDKANRLVFTVDAMGDVQRNEYDAEGQLIRRSSYPVSGNVAILNGVAPKVSDFTPAVLATLGTAVTQSRRYDRDGRLSFTVDGTGAVTEFKYDRANNLVETRAYANRIDPASWTNLASNPPVVADAARDERVRTVYDSLNRATDRVDGVGNLVRFTYDANGNVIESRAYATPMAGAALAAWNGSTVPSVTANDAVDLRQRTVYDNANRASWRVDALGNVTQYAYDADGNVIEARSYASALDAAALAAWDGHTAPAPVADDAHDLRVRNVYDMANRLSWSVDGVGAVSQFQYDANGNRTDQRTYANAVAIGTAATAAALAAAVVPDNAHDRQWHNSYDAANRLSVHTDGAGAKVTYQYDGNGNVVDQRAYANAAQADDLRDVHTRSAYDGANRLTWRGDGTGAVSSFNYDGIGNLVRQVDYATPLTGDVVPATANDRITAMAYDGNGRRTFVVDALGGVSRTVYDAFGNVTQQVGYANRIAAPGAGTVYTEADVLAAVSVSYANANGMTPGQTLTGGQSLYSADGRYQAIFQLDGNLVVYDRQQSMQAVWNSQTTGSGADRFVFQTDGNLVIYAGAQAVWNAGSAGRGGQQLVMQTDGGFSLYAGSTPVWSSGIQDNSSGGTNVDRIQRYAYDQANRQVFSVDAMGAATESTYDGVGNATKTQSYAKALNTAGLSATASAAEVRTRVVTDAANDRIYQRAFDAAGRQVYGMDALGYVTQSVYDGLGQTLSTTQYATALSTGTTNTVAGIAAAVVANVSDRTITSNHDAAGRVVARTDAMGFTESWSYNAVGDKLSYTNAKGSVWSYGYDRAGRMVLEVSPQVELTSVTPGGNGTLQVNASASGLGNVITQLTYDALGNLRSRTEGAGRPEQRTTIYEYDQVGRQIKVIYPQVNVYTGETDVAMAANGANGQAARVETLVSLFTETTYDALGNAVTNLDIGGHRSYKTYDLVGRVVHDVDALGSVTGYGRNTFGEVTGLTRFAATTTLTTGSPASLGTAQVTATVNAMRSSADRLLQTEYDRLGRVIQVSEPEVFGYDATLANSTFNAAKVTRNTYDTFGQLVQVAQKKDATAGTWTVTSSFFDRRGQKLASVDAMGYVTQEQFDAAGNVVWHTEYANADASWTASHGLSTMAGWTGATNAGASGTAPTPVLNGSDDRTTTAVYDRNNRKTSETRLNVEHSTASNGTSTRGNLTTAYAYDAVGNLTVTTDATGARTTSYYDALGRVTAVSEPTRTVLNSDGVATAITPLTVFKRDAYGNVVAKTEFINGGWANEGITGYIATGPGADRQPLYRLVSTDGTNNHFYTVNAQERDALVTSGAWNYEGPAGYLATTQVAGTTPLYRLVKGGDHLYTISQAEIDNAIGQGWTLEGAPVGYVGAQATGDYSAALQRFYNPVANQHFFTISDLEATSLVSQAIAVNSLPAYVTIPNPAIAALGSQWGIEGTLGYFSSTPFDGGVPMYQLVNAINGQHLYTTDPVERASLMGIGLYRDNGSVGYLAIAQTPGTVPVYRMALITPLGLVHFLTTNTDEVNLRVSQGYSLDGVVGYVASVPDGALDVPLLRLLGPFADHLYLSGTVKAAPDPVRDAALFANTDRTSYALYDVMGHTVQTTDAMGVNHFSSYNSQGLVAKDWQAVSGNDGIAHTLFRGYDYDALGRQTHVYDPALATDNIGTGASGAVNVTSPIAYVVPAGLIGIPGDTGYQGSVTFLSNGLVDPVGGAVRVQIDYMTLGYTEPGSEQGGDTIVPSRAASYEQLVTASAAAHWLMIEPTAADGAIGWVRQIRLEQLVGDVWKPLWTGSPESATGGTRTLSAAQASGLYTATPSATVLLPSGAPFNGLPMNGPRSGGVVTVNAGNIIDHPGGEVRVGVDYYAKEVTTTQFGGPSQPDIVTTTPAHWTTQYSASVSSAAAQQPIQVVPEAPIDTLGLIRVQQKINGIWVTLWEGTEAEATGKVGFNTAATSTAVGVVDTAMAYNAFGELVNKGVNGGQQEYFDYDNAGQLWRTNAGDGVDKVALYDLQGHQTAQILSGGNGRGNLDLHVYGSAQEVAGLADVRRSNTSYDLLGRVVEQALPERLETQGGVTALNSQLGVTVNSTTTPYIDAEGYIGWSGTNSVTLSWPGLLEGLGSGEVLIKMTIVQRNEDGSEAASHVMTAVVDASRAGSGYTFEWTNDPGVAVGGLVRIAHVEVSKKDINATWTQLINQDGAGDIGQSIRIAAPTDVNSNLQLQLRLVGSGDQGWHPIGVGNPSWNTWFGDAVFYDVSDLPEGNYEYRVYTTAQGQSYPAGQPGDLTATGVLSVTPKPLTNIGLSTSLGVAADTFAWQAPAGDAQTIRIRVAGSSDPWVEQPIGQNSGWSTISLAGLAGGTYEYELLWRHPGDAGPYAHATGQIAKVPGTPGQVIPGTPAIPPSGSPYAHIAGIRVEMQSFLTGFVNDEPVYTQAQVIHIPLPPGGSNAAFYVWPAGGTPSAQQGVNPNDIQGTDFGVHIRVSDMRYNGLATFGPGTYLYSCDYVTVFGIVGHAEGQLTIGADGSVTLVDTTQPYNPGSPGTPDTVIPGTPTQYGQAATTPSSPYAISEDPWLGGRQLNMSQGVNGVSGYQRPVVLQNTDRWGNVVSITDPRSTAWQTSYRYNANNQMVQQVQTDSDGNAGADAQGNIVNGNAPVTRIYYDAMGRQVAVRDANDHVNGNVYDAGGNLVQELHADGGVVQHAFNAFGNEVLSVDAMGHATAQTFDKLNRLMATSHVGTNIVETRTWDQAGRQLSQTNGAGETIRYAYDLRGNLATTTLPMGQSSMAVYDVMNRKAMEIDANGATVTWQYNYFGQLTGHIDLGGASYGYTYDNARQLTAQSSTRGQNRAYSYDAAGQLLTITDYGTGTQTDYRYDLSGRRIRETTVRGGVTYQDNFNAYDALGRLRWTGDTRSSITMDYDLVGNREFIKINLNADAPDPASQRYYQYDAMNRQVVVDALDYEGTNLGPDGHRLTYDLNGNRTSDTKNGVRIEQQGGAWTPVAGETTEVYGYDTLDRLTSITRDDTVIDMRSYDNANRVKTSGRTDFDPIYAALHLGNQVSNGNDPLQSRSSEYDANGRVTSQLTSSHVLKMTPLGMLPGTSFSGVNYNYDAAGNVTGYLVSNADFVDPAQSSFTRTVNTLERAEGYRQSISYSQTTAALTGTLLSQGGVGYGYDVNGHLAYTGDAGDMSVTRNHSFVNDANGTALYAYYGDAANPQQGQRQLVVNGEVLGRYGWVPNEHYAGIQFPVPGFTPFVQESSFSFGYQPINGNYPAGTPGTYAVGEGDTLQGIAKGAYGDASLWYLIADANGLTGNAELRVGQVLTIPARVSSANNAGTFQPYDPSRIMGDTSPTMMAVPQAQDKGCGVVGQIIMVVVAVVVTIYTAGAASAAFGAAGASTATVGATMTSGLSALAGSAGAAGFAGAVVGGAVGSIVSQGVGIAIGAQESFSWKGVALGAIGAGIGAGLGGAVTPFGTASQGALVGNAVVRGAIGSAASQGIAVAMGLQEKFSWKSVAASAAGAGVGQAVGGALSTEWGGTPMDDFAVRAVSGFAGGLTTAALRGGRISATQVAVDAFGNALGESLAGAMGQRAERTDDLDAFLKLNDNFSGVDANGGAIMVNGQTFSQNAAATRTAGNPAGLPSYVNNGGGAPASFSIDPSGNGILGWQDRVSAQPSTVRAGDYGGSMERIARAQLGSGASQRDINNYVGQLIEINGISNPRRVGGDLDIILPGANTPAATSGLGVYGKDIAQGEQMKAAARAEQMAASAQAATGAYLGAGAGRGFLNPADASTYGAYPFAGRSTITDAQAFAPGMSAGERTKAAATGVGRTLAGTAESMGYSYGVIGSPQERADWAIRTVDAGIASAKRFFGDMSGSVSNFFGGFSSNDPYAVESSFATGTGVAIGVGGGVVAGRLMSPKSVASSGADNIALFSQYKAELQAASEPRNYLVEPKFGWLDDGTLTYKVGSLNKGYGLGADLSPQGVLSIEVQATNPNLRAQLGSGTEMYNDMIRRIGGPDNIQQINGIWSRSSGLTSNLESFEANYALTGDKYGAAAQTWSGRRAASYGFRPTDVQITPDGVNAIFGR